MKQINTRISQKHDFESKWLLKTNFIPYSGEIIVYDQETDVNGNVLTGAYVTGTTLPNSRTEAIPYARIKIWDGTTVVSNLPFIGATGSGEGDLEDALQVHIDNKSNPHNVTADQIGAATTTYVDNKVASATITIDSALSSTSTNAVQNKVVKSAIDAAMPKSGGTFTGEVVAQNNTTYTTKQIRNIFLVEEGETLPGGANGDVCLVYKP